MKRTTASIIAAALLTLGFAGGAQAARSGHFSGGHFSGPSHFRGPAPGFGGFHHFHSAPRVFIGGAFVAPFFYPPPVYAYPPAYYEPAPAYQTYWYCPAYGAYYPTVQQCPGGWQQVVQ
ncbi:MAG TPA: hypothetical protein VFB08_21215 [Burkholderiales bacterium]|nr:hypothetical protein [Burkholderiales bacterium]